MEIHHERPEAVSARHLIARIVVVGVVVGVTVGGLLKLFGVQGPLFTALTASLTAAATTVTAFLRREG
jgi:hypothetical protein